MDTKLGFELKNEQIQKLVMTPELIQSIQILQFNSQELEAYAADQLLSNPCLEKAENPADAKNEEINWKEIIRNSHHDTHEFAGSSHKNDSDEDYSYEKFTASELRLADYLTSQLNIATNDKHLINAGEYIIDSIDDNGYLTLPLEEIAAESGECLETCEDSLHLIQCFDPTGVGARDIKECLIIQLAQLGILTEDFNTLISEHFENLGMGRITAVAKAMNLEKSEIQTMTDIIRTLEPKPGRKYIPSSDTCYVTPDVSVEKTENGYIVTSNDATTPQLTISSYYNDLLSKADNDKELAEYLSDRIASATWLINSINQRKTTITNIVKEIVEYQRDFFDKGSKYMKPLTLRTIADNLDIHQSTVSRAVNGKYMQTPRGVFEIRHFFTSGVQSTSDGNMSSSSVKEHIKELVDAEDKAKPLSDQAIVSLLNDKGISISRRTVAKYRDELCILSSSKRKKY